MENEKKMKIARIEELKNTEKAASEQIL